MIPSRHIRTYLQRPVDDHRWMKQLTHKQMDELINSLRPRPKLWPGLHLHQKIAFYLGVQYGFEDEETGGGFSYWIGMGGGKSLITLELLKYWHQCREMHRALVFVLTDKAYPTWEEQTKQYNIDLPIIALEGSSEEKWQTLDQFDNGIVLVHYPGAVAMCSSAAPNKKGKSKWKLDPKLVNRLMKGVDVLVMDESTRLGHHQSLSHKLCNKIANNVKIRYALAGLPFGRDPEILWAQQKIIDGGISFGPTLEFFRSVFYRKEKNLFSKSRFAWTYTFDKEKRADDLSRLMQHRSITFEDHEMADVPPIVYSRVPIRLTGRARDYYMRAKQELKEITKKGGERTAVENIFLRMRQITSGYLGFVEKNQTATGETLVKRARVELEKPKLEALMEKIESLPVGRKAVVFYDYTPSGYNITNELNKSKINHIWLWAGTKNPRKELQKFMTDKRCTVAVMNSKVGAYSVDGLQRVANYLFYYESPVPVIDRKQSEKRVQRTGQKRRVYVFDFVCTGTVDERILEFHKEGSDLMRRVRRDPRALLGKLA